MYALPTVAAVEGLRFSYALHPLPPGGFGFRRWRFELWHGARMVAAGWRVTQRDAARAITQHAARAGHQLLGVRTRGPEAPVAHGTLVPGASVRVDAGPVSCVLVPRGLDELANLS